MSAGLLRSLRFLAPNLATALAMACAMASIERSLAGDITQAAWLVVWCTLLDKLDGMVARLLGAESSLGAQLDSLADLLSFGVAPSVLVLAAGRNLGASVGPPSLFTAAAMLYVVATAWRLARFNVTALPPGSPPMFFGVPSTVVGGLVATFYLSANGPLGASTCVATLPAVLLAGATLMVCRLRFPKLTRLRSRLARALLASLTAAAYLAGFARHWPEFLFLYAASSLLVAMLFHLMSPAARAVHLPPLFQAPSRGGDFKAAPR